MYSVTKHLKLNSHQRYPCAVWQSCPVLQSIQWPHWKLMPQKPQRSNLLAVNTGYNTICLQLYILVRLVHRRWATCFGDSHLFIQTCSTSLESIQCLSKPALLPWGAYSVCWKCQGLIGFPSTFWAQFVGAYSKKLFYDSSKLSEMPFFPSFLYYQQATSGQCQQQQPRRQRAKYWLQLV